MIDLFVNLRESQTQATDEEDRDMLTFPGQCGDCYVAEDVSDEASETSRSEHKKVDAKSSHCGPKLSLEWCPSVHTKSQRTKECNE